LLQVDDRNDFKLNQGTVMFKAKRQCQIAHSFKQAELLAAGDCLTELQYLICILKVLSHKEIEVERLIDSKKSVLLL
jgi:hypothetical protein